jgi:hypothetical protein
LPRSRPVPPVEGSLVDFLEQQVSQAGLRRRYLYPALASLITLGRQSNLACISFNLNHSVIAHTN